MWYNTYCSVDKYHWVIHHSFSIHLNFRANIESCIKKCLQLYWITSYIYMYKKLWSSLILFFVVSYFDEQIIATEICLWIFSSMNVKIWWFCVSFMMVNQVVLHWFDGIQTWCTVTFAVFTNLQ